MSVKITTNHHQRELISSSELPEKAREQFDYITTEEFDEHLRPRFVKYRDWWYDTSDVERVTSPDLAGWDGYASDSYWSGIVIKWGHDWSGQPDHEAVIIGSFYVKDDLDD